MGSEEARHEAPVTTNHPFFHKNYYISIGLEPQFFLNFLLYYYLLVGVVGL